MQPAVPASIGHCAYTPSVYSPSPSQRLNPMAARAGGQPPVLCLMGTYRPLQTSSTFCRAALPSPGPLHTTSRGPRAVPGWYHPPLGCGRPYSWRPCCSHLSPLPPSCLGVSPSQGDRGWDYVPSTGKPPNRRGWACCRGQRCHILWKDQSPPWPKCLPFPGVRGSSSFLTCVAHE